MQSSSSGNTYYYVEVRTQTGFDAGYAPGVLLHTGNDANGNSSQQIDLDPVSTSFDSILNPGQSFTDSAIGLTITTVSADAAGAWVTVQMPDAPCTYSLSPTTSGTLTSTAQGASFYGHVRRRLQLDDGHRAKLDSHVEQRDRQRDGELHGGREYGRHAIRINHRRRTDVHGVAGRAPMHLFAEPDRERHFASAATGGTTTVTAGSGCAWSATTTKSWIHTSSTGSGSGTLSYTVDANSGQARSGTIRAGGQTYTVSQGAAGTTCSYALSPASSGTLAPRAPRAAA